MPKSPQEIAADELDARQRAMDDIANASPAASEALDAEDDADNDKASGAVDPASEKYALAARLMQQCAEGERQAGLDFERAGDIISALDAGDRDYDMGMAQTWLTMSILDFDKAASLYGEAADMDQKSADAATDATKRQMELNEVDSYKSHIAELRKLKAGAQRHLAVVGEKEAKYLAKDGKASDAAKWYRDAADARESAAASWQDLGDHANAAQQFGDAGDDRAAAAGQAGNAGDDTQSKADHADAADDYQSGAGEYSQAGDTAQSSDLNGKASSELSKSR